MGKSGNRQVQFKQFTVCDDGCAMKVGTDALLLGAWCEVSQAKSILDIGTGSGIVVLMLAQRAENAQLVAVELEQGAHEQSCENIKLSPFSHRVQSFNQSIQEFSVDQRWSSSFDVVVSNPPFFHDKPKSPDFARNLARHDDALPLHDLLDSALRCLKQHGKLMLIWPIDRREELFDEAAAQGLYVSRELTVQGSPSHEPTRFLSEWSRTPSQRVERETMCVESGNRENGSVKLSEEYVQLLNPYVRSLES